MKSTSEKFLCTPFPLESKEDVDLHPDLDFWT